jgi:hypothetical protein
MKNVLAIGIVEVVDVVAGVVVVVIVVVGAIVGQPFGLQQHRRRELELVALHVGVEVVDVHVRDDWANLGLLLLELDAKDAHVGGTVSLIHFRAASIAALLLIAAMEATWQLPAPHVASHEAPLAPSAQPLGEIGGVVGQALEPQQQMRWKPVWPIEQIADPSARLHRGE